MFNANLSPEQRLQKAVIDIMANPKYVALAGVMMIGTRRISDAVPTACTDGRDEYYGRAFVDSLNDAQLRFLILHEVYHKLYRHLVTWKWMWDENQQLANAACDYVINVKIADDNVNDRFATMDGPLANGCYDDTYRNWDSAQVFHDLKKKFPPQGGGGEGKGDAGGSGGDSGGDSGGELPKGFDEHDWEAAKEMTVKEKQELARDIDEAIRQGAMAAGKMGSGGDRDFGDLLQPQVDWREVMREFITATCSGADYSTWQRPSRRYIGANIYMPSGISERIGEIVIAIDTSGSIGQRELTVMLSEVQSIAETVHPEAVRLLYWDTSVCADEKYGTGEVENIVNSTKPAGGGGTMIECVPKYIADENIKAQAVVVLTDGYLGGSWGNWHSPVLWVLLDNKGANPSVGTSVHVTSRDL